MFDVEERFSAGGVITDQKWRARDLVRAAAKAFASRILLEVPDGPDQQRALEICRDAWLVADTAIVQAAPMFRDVVVVDEAMREKLA